MTLALDQVLSHIRKLVAAENAGQWTDAQLLERFTRSRDEEAFAALVHRHGGMVLGVCRRILQNDADAEDACQATFLVLARKSGSIRRQDTLTSWLHGVALRTASSLRRQIVRRRLRDRKAVPLAGPDPVVDVTWREVQTILDEEIERLPAKFKGPLVVCYLEGQGHSEGAGQLGCSLTTFRGRLDRARELLRLALRRRGVTMSAALLAAHLAEKTTFAAISPNLLIATVKGALAGDGAVASARVLKLAKGAMFTMFWTKLKIGVAASLFIVGGLLIGLALHGPVRGDGLVAADVAVVPADGQVAVNKGDNKKDAVEVPKNASAAERKKFVGTWRLVSIEAGGKKLSEEEVVDEFIRPRILRVADLEGRKRPLLTDVSVTLSYAADGTWKQLTVGDANCTADDDQGTSEIDPARKPRTIDHKITSKNAQAVRLGLEDRQGQERRGIYQFVDADTLRICFAPPGKDRPGSLATGPDSEHKVWVFKRVPEADPIDKAIGERDAWRERAAWSTRMFRLGYVGKVQADSDQAKLTAAEETLLMLLENQEKAVREYVEDLRAAVKMGNQKVYDVAIRPMFRKSVRWAALKGEDALVVELYQLYTGHPENAVAGGTALTWAAANNDHETVGILLGRGLNVNAADANGWTALHQAVRWGDDMAELLLKKGAKINVATKKGETPLMLAAQAAFPEVVQKLLDKKAEVNARDEKGRTPLMYAAKSGRLASARLLLGYGANVRLQDKAGRTALALASAPPLIAEAGGFLTQERGKELQERASRDERELKELLKSAGGE